MIFLYRIGIFSYSLAVTFFALFNSKAKRFVEGRKDLMQKIKSADIAIHKPVWIHCASLGEFEQARSIIDALHHKGEKILITFFSPSGYDIRKEYSSADWVFYLPLDTLENATNFIKYTKPKKAVFVKYDLWFFYLSQLQEKGIPSYLISAHYNPDQIYFKALKGKLHREMLNMFKHIFLQNKQSKDLLKEININHVSVVGDTRVDGVLERAKNPNTLPKIAAFLGGEKAIVLGSAYLQEIDILNACLSEFKGEKIIIAPHVVERTNIRSIQNKLITSSVLYSELTEQPSKTNILIVDNIGKLFDIYAYAKWAFIGGGFETGLHNTLEPAAYGLPICFGPKYTKFAESTSMVSQGCAFPITSASELKALYSQLEDDVFRTDVVKKVKEYMMDSKGATGYILEELIS